MTNINPFSSAVIRPRCTTKYIYPFYNILCSQSVNHSYYNSHTQLNFIYLYRLVYDIKTTNTSRKSSTTRTTEYNIQWIKYNKKIFRFFVISFCWYFSTSVVQIIKNARLWHRRQHLTKRAHIFCTAFLFPCVIHTRATMMFLIVLTEKIYTHCKYNKKGVAWW